VLRLARIRALLGLDDGGGLAQYPDLMEKAAKVCIIEEFELCVEDHIIHRMLPVWLSFERQFALLGGGGGSALREAKDLTTKCLTFNLKFESTGTLEDVGGGGYESKVVSDVKLRFDPDAIEIRGDAALVNDEFDFNMSSCSVTSNRGGGEFTVFKLLILDQADGGLGSVRDFVLAHLPGPTSESADITCDFPGGGHTDMSLPAFPAWTAAWLVTHKDELQTEGGGGGSGESLSSGPTAGYIASDWEIYGDEYFAKKEWSKEAEGYTEIGSFKLYHRPGS
jgi:hypothetical protein